MNYMNKKNEELFELIEKYELDKDDYTQENGSLNRKKLGNILKLIDLQSGKVADEGVVVKEDENGDTVVEDYNPTVKLHKMLSGMMVQVTFYHSDENDMPYVQLGLNGIALNIKREVESWVPKEFIDGVLQNAIATKMKMHVDGQGNISYIPKQVPRFAHTTHDIKHIDVLAKEFDERQAKRQR